MDPHARDNLKTLLQDALEARDTLGCVRVCIYVLIGLIKGSPNKQTHTGIVLIIAVLLLLPPPLSVSACLCLCLSLFLSLSFFFSPTHTHTHT